MKTLAQNWLLILLLLIVFAVGIAIYGKKNREKKEAQIKLLLDILESGTGVNGVDGKSIILGVKPQIGYQDTALEIAKQIQAAHQGWYWNDNEEAVYRAFAGKTKAQIAAIYQAFISLDGQDLDAYIKSWMDDEELEQVFRIIKQAQ